MDADLRFFPRWTFPILTRALENNYGCLQRWCERAANFFRSQKARRRKKALGVTHPNLSYVHIFDISVNMVDVNCETFPVRESNPGLVGESHKS